MVSRKYSVAIVVPALSIGGGVPSFAAFLYRALKESGRYDPELISLATTARDQNSIQLLSPITWMRGLRVTTGEWRKLPYQCVGTIVSEVEIQRYRPHSVLSSLLSRYDLIQVVAGTPAWAYVTNNINRPVCLFTATLIGHERVSKLRHTRGWRRHWLVAMTSINSRLEQQTLQQIDRVFAESEYTRQILRPLVDNNRLLLGVPGVDTHLLHPDRYCCDGYILAVGRFSDPRKNVRLLFNAYRRLTQNVPRTPALVLVGTAPSVLDMEYAVSLGIRDHLFIHQNVTNEALAELYRGASLFVLSSNEEGLGIVILEAMASGLPVISTRCGGPETAVIEDETGLLTPVNDAQAMAEAMQSLISDRELRRRMGQAARQIAEERFSIASAGKIFLDQYDMLLG